MKKNFFKKKLASGLALALVVASLAPAGLSASAATATKVVKQGGGKAPTVMYVGGAKVDYSLSKVYKSNKYAWTVSDSSIATITKTTGVVTAKAPGTVTIKATARNSSGKWLNAFTHKITIKQRVTSIDINAEDFSLAVGEEKDLDAVKNPKTSTDSVRYASSDEKVATVNATTGVVKAVGVGEATITVYSKAAWNTPNTSTYNRTDSVKVTVLDGIQAVKQTTKTKLEVTLATDAKEKLTKDNLVITDANGVKQVIKEVKFSDDGKTATVETYLEFVDKATYKVSYADTEKEFVASVGKVASIVIEPKTVEYQKETALSIKLFDANGVDVTTADELRNVTFDYDAAKAYIGAIEDGKYKINVYTFPSSVSVKAVYHTYDYTDLTEKVFESTAVINSVEEIKNTATNVQYTLTSGKADWTKVNTTIPADATGYRLFMKAKDQANADLTEKDFTFESSDPTVLGVSKTDDGVYVYAIKSGVAHIKVTYGNTTQLLKVTVGAEAKAATITASKTSAVLYNSFSDEVTIDVTVKDQYGNKITSDKLVSVSDISNDIIVDNSVAGKVTFTLPKGAGKNASYTYRLTYLDRVTSVTIRTVAVTDLNETSVRVESNVNTVDVVMNDDVKSDKKVEFKAFAYNSKGEKVRELALSDSDFVVKKGNDTIANAIVTDGTVASFGALKLNGNTTVSQAAVGVYVVEYTGTIIPKPGTTKTDTKRVTFTVTNSQIKPTVKQEKTVSTASTLDALIKEAFKASGDKEIVGFKVVVNKTEYTETSDLKSVSLTKGVSVLVKSIKVAEDFTNGTVIHSVDVNKTVLITE
ncbi:hypothetical protein acsn021_09330 [Anaerocolumna cellulosilytica]|uniref:Uncharacterized protein n=1 Tax=Anaerocolumna cellulosilytica TaxID=433286 RepID=A0A6S6QRY4_9FIRM|nr:Ig-like domain-containing protein [Anaerocolumna cellulosilytica]MBB5194420.1 uncharacterized protein YjdB [Anaerocolumna cellulosilytica]BCJ93364.1 hypothetical protein acsn021_09330 [Anaerocolumna cellulosilytica]